MRADSTPDAAALSMCHVAFAEPFAGRLYRAVPALSGQSATFRPCWIHEIKHDGFRIMARRSPHHGLDADDGPSSCGLGLLGWRRYGGRMASSIAVAPRAQCGGVSRKHNGAERLSGLMAADCACYCACVLARDFASQCPRLCCLSLPTATIAIPDGSQATEWGARPPRRPRKTWGLFLGEIPALFLQDNISKPRRRNGARAPVERSRAISELIGRPSTPCRPPR